MSGRPKKRYGKVKRPVYVNVSKKLRYLLAWILVVCPICGSSKVGKNGKRRRGKGRVECFQCRNPACPFLKDHKHGKQFVLTKSGRFRTEIHALLGRLFGDLVGDGLKYEAVAKKYHISVAGVAALREAYERRVAATRGLDKLVPALVLESAVALDETFLKVQGVTIYVIIATGYRSRKILGVRVSESRKEEDIKAVITEAEQNCRKKPRTYTSDAWGATANAIKHLGRTITHVIHRHRKPYDKAIIRYVEYTEAERIVTDIGVKTDVFAASGKREYRVAVHHEPLEVPPPKPKGRPKGVKNGQGKKKSKSAAQRGPRGLFAVFKRGQKGYVRVNLRKHVIKLAANCSQAVVAAFDHAFALFAGMSIQNNLSETINGVLSSLMRPRGPRTAGTLECRLRARIIAMNDPPTLAKVKIDREVRGTFFLANVSVADYGRLAKHGWKLQGLEKIDACAD